MSGALHDWLTGLPDRHWFRDRLAEASDHARRSTEPLAVIVVDLDGFEEINDVFGQDAGDHVLVEVAARLHEAIGPSNEVARLGGDKFAVLLSTDLSTARVVGHRIAELLARPIAFGEKEIVPLAGIGVAPHDSGDTSAVLRNAHLALRSAKQSGRGNIEVFRPSQHARLLRRIRLTQDLRQAIARGELRLHYQPIVASDRTVLAVEALVRWCHPELGRVPPAEFIPLAEETGQMPELGRWVLAEACRQARAWDELRGDAPPLITNVNLSVKQLQAPDLVSEVRDVLQRTGLDPRRLVLEITESELVEDFDALIGRLEELRALEVRLAVDDFGTGYSSLSYLRRLPIDAVKVDRSFVSGIASHSREWAVIRAIVQLIGALDLVPVAEGIETGSQLAHLRALGCSLFQGYLFSPPLPPEQLAPLLTAARLPRQPARDRAQGDCA